MDLLERIQNANKRSEQNNRKSAEAQAQLKLLTKQISEKVSDYEQEFGVRFPNIEDEAKFTKFVNELLATTEADLEKQVSLAEKVNQLILEGDILGAQELLGYEPAEELVEDLDAEEGTESAELEDEIAEEVELEDIAPKRVIEDEPIVKPTAPVRNVTVDELEEEPIAPVRPATRRTVVSDDLEEEEFVAPTKRRTVVDDEDGAPVVKPYPRRTVVADEDEDVAPVKPAQRRTVITDDLEDLDETPVIRPRKSPIVTSNFGMEEEDAGVSLKELNAVAGVAPRGVSPKAKSPIVTDDLEEEEIVVRPRKRAIIVDDEDSDDVAPARPVRSGGSFKFD